MAPRLTAKPWPPPRATTLGAPSLTLWATSLTLWATSLTLWATSLTLWATSSDAFLTMAFVTVQCPGDGSWDESLGPRCGEQFPRSPPLIDDDRRCSQRRWSGKTFLP